MWSQTKYFIYYFWQRWNPVGGFCEKLLPSDRWQWSDVSGLKHQQLDSFTLPSPHWEWESDWYVDENIGGEPTEKGVGEQYQKEIYSGNLYSVKWKELLQKCKKVCKNKTCHRYFFLGNSSTLVQQKEGSCLKAFEVYRSFCRSFFLLIRPQNPGNWMPLLFKVFTMKKVKCFTVSCLFCVYHPEEFGHDS